MNNTANKLSHTVVEEFTQAHKTTEFLRNFLITSSNDAGKTYELLKTFHKYADEEGKARFNHALKLLEDIVVRRVEITTSIFFPEGYEHPQTEESNVVQMYARLEDILSQVKAIMLKGINDKSRADAFEKLKISVGSGKVKNAEGNAVLWNNDTINAYLDSLEKEIKKAEEKKTENKSSENKKSEDNKSENKIPEKEKVSFKTVLGFAEDMAKNKKNEVAVKEAIKKYVVGKLITSEGNNVFIKDESIFNTYYTNTIEAFVKSTIAVFEKKEEKEKPVESRLETVEKEIEAMVKPALEELKESTEKLSFAKLTKSVKNMYLSSDIHKTLSDSLLKVMELAEKYTPDLYAKYKESRKGITPVEPIKDTKKEIEIFDNSYNVSEVNKPLWKEVENYTDFTTMSYKAEEITSKGNWKDALSMCIILMSSGKIKEKPEDKEAMGWTEDQIKDWFYTNILKETVIKAEDSSETKVDAKTDAKSAEKTEEKTETKTTETKPVVGPAAPKGFTEEESENTKLISSKFKETLSKYKFASFGVKTTHHANKIIQFQVAITKPDEEPTLIATKDNFSKLIDSLRNKLIESSNNFPKVKQELKDALKDIYNISDSEIKHIVRNLAFEAEVIRKEAKKTSTSEQKSAENKAEESKKETTTSKTTDTIEDVSKDEEGTLYYESLKVGESVMELKDGKKVKATDGEFILDVENNLVCNITIHNGIFTEISEPYKEETDEADEEETKSPLGEVVGETKSSETEEKEETKSQDTTPTEAIATESSSNSNKDSNKETDPYIGFEDIVKSKDKLSAHKAIFAKANEYTDLEEGKRIVFDTINKLRKDGRYKKTFVRNWKTANEPDLRKMIDNIINTGLEFQKKKQ